MNLLFLNLNYFTFEKSHGLLCLLNLDLVLVWIFAQIDWSIWWGWSCSRWEIGNATGCSSDRVVQLLVNTCLAVDLATDLDFAPGAEGLCEQLRFLSPSRRFCSWCAFYVRFGRIDCDSETYLKRSFFSSRNSSYYKKKECFFTKSYTFLIATIGTVRLFRRRDLTALWLTCARLSFSLNWSPLP